MTDQYIFTETVSENREHTMSSFPLWTKEMFLEKVRNQKSNNHGRYRYGKVGGHMSLLKDMLVEEFEQVFCPNEFTKEQITEIFREKISEKHGIKCLTKEELERGCVYEDFSGCKWLYYGEVEQTINETHITSYKKYKKPLEIKVGLGFDRYFSSDHKPSAIVDVLKSPKKLKCKIEDIKFKLNDKYISETDDMMYNRDMIGGEITLIYIIKNYEIKNI